MRRLALAEAKSELDALAANFQASDANGADALASLVRWYSETRVDAAGPDEDDDMLQLVAGVAEIEPFGSRWFVSVDRLVSMQGAEEQTALGLTMVFDVFIGPQPEVNDAFARLATLHADVVAFVQHPFVAALLASAPQGRLVSMCEI